MHLVQMRHLFTAVPVRTFRALCSVSILSLVLLASAAPAHATYNDLLGFPELQAQLGANIPTGDGIAIHQVEARAASGVQAGNYSPDATNAGFTGKSIINETLQANVPQSAAGISNHANSVALNAFGQGTSIAPGISSIQSFEANHWLGFQLNGTAVSANSTGFLNTLGNVPKTTDARIVNHSWVGQFSSNSINSQILRRLDYVVEQDDLINIVGIQNGFANADSNLLKTSFNDISVGLTSGEHLNSTVAVDVAYQGGRVAPEIVTPGFNPQNSATLTSFAAPMATAASALLLETARDSGLSNGTVTNRTRTINHAETSEVIKAVLMAGADRAVDNPRGSDLVDYAVNTSNNLDSRYGAGQLNVHHSYNILAAGEHDSDQDRGSSEDIASQGWDYDSGFGGDNGSNDRASYFFTAGNSGDTLQASLAWNIDIAGFTTHAANTTLHDLNLLLIDVTNNQLVSSVGASSMSTTENTENIFFSGLVAGNRYELRVEPGSGQAAFDWDYALAWKIASVPEPGSMTVSLLGALTASGLGGWRLRRG